MAVILVISNPISGDGNGPSFIRDNVLPLLESVDLKYELRETEEAGTAGDLALSFLKTHKDNKEAVIVVSGGDGTVHEVVNGLGNAASLGHVSPENPYVVRIILCPQGTANALYSTLFPRSSNDSFDLVEYRLKSLRAFLDGTSRPLTLTRTQLLARGDLVQQTVLGVVVSSTALHAAILKSAEQLRADVPGIDRFKVAARENISTWYHATALLHPSKVSRKVKLFDPQQMEFKPLEPAGGSAVHISGPFAYFLSTVNVDRLEPDFQISPLFASIPPAAGELDLVVIRPLRNPLIESETAENRANFVRTMLEVSQAAYRRGSHVNMTYGKDETELSEGGGPYIVEYYRCGGWTWEPSDFDEAAHTVCVDGAILTIGMGDKACCEVVDNNTMTQFRICA